MFHYPPEPQIPRSSNGEDLVDPDESDGELDLDLNPINGVQQSRTNGHSELYSNLNARQDTSLGPHKVITASSTILGYSEETLQRLLAPGCWSDRTKFEICLNELTFLGHPIYAAQEGRWDKKHTHEETHAPKKDQRGSTPTPKTRAEQDFADMQTTVGITITEPKTPVQEKRDFTHIPESFDSSQTGGQSLATSVNSESSISATVVPEQLTMFNIVFVLAAPESPNSSAEVSDVYRHITKKLSKALHYCQNENQYLGIESRKLLTLKAKARQDGITDAELLSKRMVESSELAWALREVYEKISANEIAGIRLNGMPISLQVPLDESVQFSDKEDLTTHAGLLLLEEKDGLLRELANSGPSPLDSFIRGHTPTKSLQKQATNLGMPIQDVLALARHLTKWRKARVISPLHQRNTYIVGRDAPLDKLESFYIADYARKFAVLPSLLQVLKVLSGKPMRYGMLIPSRDHREPYMEILAYLVQYRFVEQLKTYGWLQASNAMMSKSNPAGEQDLNQNKRPLDVLSLLSPQMRPLNDDDTLSVSSERTTIPISVVESRKALKSTTSSPYNNTSTPGEIEIGSEAKLQIITDPHTLSAEDRRRLQNIQDSVNDAELSERLPSLLRHFDGESAFEEIAAREGLKRSKVEGWLDNLLTSGFLVTFRAV